MEQVPRADPVVQRLAAAQQVEVRARHDGTDEPGTHPSAADVGVVVLAQRATGSHWAAALCALRAGGRGRRAIGLYVSDGYRPILASGADVGTPRADSPSSGRFT